MDTVLSFCSSGRGRLAVNQPFFPNSRDPDTLQIAAPVFAES